MRLPPGYDIDRYAIAAIALTAMCLVTADHEALGHGGTCLAMGGQVEILTSSIFRCTTRSVWIAPAGPLTSVLAGGASLLLANRIPRRLATARLLLTLIAAFSFFWESGYAVQAMLGRDGDLYFASEDLLGSPSLGWRIAAAAVGVLLYAMTARWVSRALAGLFPTKDSARQAGRIAWTTATMGAALAALFNVGHGWGGFKDAVLEIGAASVPLLWIAWTTTASEAPAPPAPVERSAALICLSLAIYGAFVATLGRGLYF